MIWVLPLNGFGCMERLLLQSGLKLSGRIRSISGVDDFSTI